MFHMANAPGVVEKRTERSAQGAKVDFNTNANFFIVARS